MSVQFELIPKKINSILLSSNMTVDEICLSVLVDLSESVYYHINYEYKLNVGLVQNT